MHMDPPAVIVVALILCAWAYCASLLPLAAGQDSPAPDMIRYHVRNRVADTDVGKRFDELFGEGRMEQIMSNATAAVRETLAVDPRITDVYMTFKKLSSETNAGVAYGNNIDLNSRFFSRSDGSVVPGKLEDWTEPVIYHEMAHDMMRPDRDIVHGQPLASPEEHALEEGMAHYVAMRAGHPPPDCTERSLRDTSWRDGYCPTMYFLRYLATPTLGGVGIVAEINRRLNDHGYLEDDFVDLLGSTPDELWQQFLDTLPGPNIGLQQLVAGAGQAGRNKAATTSYIY